MEKIVIDLNKTSAERFTDNSEGKGGKLWSKVSSETQLNKFIGESVNTVEKWTKLRRTDTIVSTATVTVFAFENMQDPKSGTPCANARCYVAKNQMGTVVSEEYTDEFGCATLMSVPEGKYELYVDAVAMDLQIVEIDIKAGETYHYDVFCYES